jgi:hypothetical protein
MDGETSTTCLSREWQAALLPIFDAAMSEGLDEHFRAGQSMYYLMFSTAEEHGLERYSPVPPFVTLGAR